MDALHYIALSFQKKKKEFHVGAGAFWPCKEKKKKKKNREANMTLVLEEFFLTFTKTHIY